METCSLFLLVRRVPIGLFDLQSSVLTKDKVKRHASVNRCIKLVLLLTGSMAR